MFKIVMFSITLLFAEIIQSPIYS